MTFIFFQLLPEGCLDIISLMSDPLRRLRWNGFAFRFARRWKTVAGRRRVCVFIFFYFCRMQGDILLLRHGARASLASSTLLSLDGDSSFPKGGDV